MSSDRILAIQKLKKIVENLKIAYEQTIGLEMEQVEDVTVRKYKSRGYSKGAKVKIAKKIHFEDIDIEAPKQIDAMTIASVFEEIVRQLEVKEKPEKSKLKAILSKLAPYGSWATLAYTILHNCGIL